MRTTCRQEARTNNRISTLTLSSKGKIKRAIRHRVTGSCVRGRLRTINGLNRRTFTRFSLVLYRLRLLRPYTRVNGQRVCRFNSTLSTGLRVINFLLRSNTVTVQASNLTSRSTRRRAMLCLMLILLRRSRRFISTRPIIQITLLIQERSVPRPIFLLLNRFMMELRSQRIM